jgi:pantoate--beta-alanine ligase
LPLSLKTGVPMKITTIIADVRRERWHDTGLTWGLVPTMGALHEGHLSLVRLAKQQNDRVAASIFVNPKQFNNPADLAKYPRNPEADLDLLRAEGVDLVWAPPVGEVYPPGFQTTVTVEETSKPLEGASRPGHFAGVATVVAKLFNVFQPTRAYFGQKDAQQVAVIRQMVRDLVFNLDIVVGPTVRESDGLALSSRNVRLDPLSRAVAPVLYKALSSALEAWRQGERDANTLRTLMAQIVNAEPLAMIDYISAADPVTLAELHGPADHALLSMAVFFGDVRLIDNLTVE